MDQLHTGAYATISAAIEAAAPGDTLLIRPGTYEESLIINKAGLEIRGDGDIAEIVVEATNSSTLVFRATTGHVRNLTLRQTGGEAPLFGAFIGQGHLRLIDCDISSESGSCISIRGARATLRGNRIHDATQVGVLITNGAQGTLEYNEISANTNRGVHIRDEGTYATVRGNRIIKNKQGGVWVYNKGGALIADNEIKYGDWFSPYPDFLVEDVTRVRYGGLNKVPFARRGGH